MFVVTLDANATGSHSVELELTPLIRQATSLPWVNAYPNRTTEFSYSTSRGNGPFLHTHDNHSAAQSAFGLVDPPTTGWSVSPSGGKFSLNVFVLAGLPSTLQFLLVAGNGSWPALGERRGVDATFRALSQAEAFADAWRDSARRWERRWQDAFTPGNGHFSGHLPLLESPSVELRRIYYNALLTVVSLERTNLPLVAPRVYLTAAGNALPYNCETCYPRINGLLEVGAAAAYYWDIKQIAHVISLLDPAGFRAFLAFVLSLPPVGGKPGFTASNGIDLFTGTLFGAWYAFNSQAIFTSLHVYLAATGDRSFAQEVYNGKSVVEWMTVLSSHWKAFALTTARQPEPFLADYGGFAGDFLECVPTYVNAVPALQAGNAWMMRRAAELQESRHALSGRGRDNLGADRMRWTAASIVNATVRRLWVPGGDGVWGCLNGANDTLTAVRGIVDFQALGNLLTEADGAADTYGGNLPESVRKAMADFFMRELAHGGGDERTDWPIALSRKDALGFIDRPDHGTTGAYSSWPSLAASALAELDGGFERAMPFILGTAPAARLGPFGQASAVQTVGPPVGKFGVPAFKTTRGADRYTALAGGAWAELIIGTVFGWRPRVDGGVKLWRASVARGVTGVLRNVRLPNGAAQNISLTERGPRFAKTDDASLAALEVGTGEHLMFDEHWTQNSTGLQLAVNPPTKSGMILKPEYPWEPIIFAGNTLVKVNDSDYRIYYDALGAAPRSVDPSGQNGYRYTCVAISSDGVSGWRKPMLDVHPFFDGNTNMTHNKTNIIAGDKFLGNIFYDGPSKTFIGFSHGYTFTSSDGFTFEPTCRQGKVGCICGKSTVVPTCRHLNFSGPAGMYYDNATAAYNVFFRTTPPRSDGAVCPGGDPSNPASPHQRAVGMIRVTDILAPDWGPGDHTDFAPSYNTTVLAADTQDDPCLSVYSANPLKLGDMYAMTPLMFLNCNDTNVKTMAKGGYPRACAINPVTSPKLPAVNRKDRSDGFLEAHFAVSRDGKSYTRLSREAFVPRGVGRHREGYVGVYEGDFDAGSTTVAVGSYVVGNQQIMVQSGWQYTHAGIDDGLFPELAPNLAPGQIPGGPVLSGLQLLTSRRNGFVALRTSAPTIEGAWRSKPLLLPSCSAPSELELSLNTMVSIAGFLEVALEGASSGAMVSVPVIGNFVDHTVRWRNTTTPAKDEVNPSTLPRAYQGATVRLRLAMKEASLFAFQFRCAHPAVPRAKSDDTTTMTAPQVPAVYINMSSIAVINCPKSLYATCPEYEIQAAAFAVQALVNRAANASWATGRPAPLLFVNMGAADLDFTSSEVTWMRYLASTNKASFSPLANQSMCGLIERFGGGLKGSVRYRSDGFSIYLALTLAGLHDLVPVSDGMAAQYPCLAALPVAQTVANFSDKFAMYDYAIKAVLPLTSRTVLWNADDYNNAVGAPGKDALMSVDYPISQRAFIMNLCPLWQCDEVECHQPTTRKATPREAELFVEIVSSRDELVSVFGWSDPEHACTVFCSFRTANLAYFASLSSIRRTAPLPLPQHDRGQALDPDTLYLLFETNEGDTPRILTSQMDSAWMSPARGSVPIAWAVDPLLGQLFPELLNLYVQTATQNDSFVAGLDGAGYVYLSSLGSHAEAYERRAATLMAKFNTPVVDVGIPGLNLERPDLTTASTLSEMEAYRSAALRSGQPAPAAFLNACGSHYGQPLLTWLRDGTPVLNSLCTGPVSNSSTGPCHDSNGHCQDSHYLYYYRDHLNQSAPASDLAGRLTWARKTYRRPGQPMFLLVYGGLGDHNDFFSLQEEALGMLDFPYQVLRSAELARLARDARSLLPE